MAFVEFFDTVEKTMLVGNASTRYGTFITGYVRNLENDFRLRIPKSIRYLILTFYPTVIHYQGNFLKSNCGNQIIIINQHEITGYFSAKLDEALPINLSSSIINEIKYEWKLQITGKIERQNWYFIGVVSNRCTNFDTWVNYGSGRHLIDAYGITLLENHVSLGQYLKSESQYNKTPKSNQIIIVEYIISISHNEQCSLNIYVVDNKDKHEDDVKTLIYSINLPKDNEICSWFPVFSKPNNRTRIKLIPYQDDFKGGGKSINDE